MKSLLRIVAVLSAVFALPLVCPAASSRTWASLTPSPANTSVAQGMATNVTTTVTAITTGGASTRFFGPAALTVSIAPAATGLGISLSLTNLDFPVGSGSGVNNYSTNSILTVATTSLTPANTYVATIIINTNGVLQGSPLPTPLTNTFTVNVGTVGSSRVWTPGGVNGLWSNGGNWSPSGAPSLGSDVQFNDAGLVGSVGTVDNTVDGAFTIGSLTYGQTNNFHTTLINPGLTLNVTGANGLAAGTGTAAGDGWQPFTTVIGPGATLVVSNASALINVDQSQPLSSGNSTTMATLDLSGLDTFNATVARVLVGEDTSPALRGACGVLNLAKTNKITVAAGSAAPQIDVGANVLSGATPGLPSILLLGQTNAIFADSIAVGRGKSAAGGGPSMMFNSSFANPVAWFRGTNGATSRVGLWSIGDAWGAKSSQNSGTNDFSLGTVNALVDQMFLGVGASQALVNGANVPGIGTLIFSAGTIDVNTLEIGYSRDATGNGTVNANGGSLIVNTNLELAHGGGSSGTLNISSATVTANGGVTAGSGNSAIAITSGTFNCTNNGTTIGSAGAPLTTLTVNNATIKVPVQVLGPSATVGTLACAGANTISISSVPALPPPLPAQFTVIKYSSSSGDLGSLTLGTMPPASPAYTAHLSNNVANSSIDLVITAGPVVYPMIWSGGASGDWDTTTSNWKTNGIAAKFQQGYPILEFDDTLTAHTTINLTTALTFGSLTVNNSANNYTFTGPGKLSGSGSLLKLGSASLTLTESGGDDSTGGVTVDGGTLQVGAGGTSGTLPSGSAVGAGAGATLAFDRSDNLAVPNVISGSGTLVQKGLSILALNASNSAFAGNINIASGTLRPGNVASLGSGVGSVNVSNAATLDVNGLAFNNNQPITAVGTGVGGNGAIVNNNTNSPNQILRNVTLTGPTTFGGASDWDIHSSGNPVSDATLSTGGNGFKLTKTSTNTVTLFGVQVDGVLGDIDILAGALSFERNCTSLGDTTKTITVYSNATLQLANASNNWSKVVVLKDGATFRAVNRDQFEGAVTLESGAGTVQAGTGAQLILDGVVSGSGGLTKSSSGSLTLNSVNTYTGTTLVSGGTLALGSSGAIDTSTNVTVAAGAILDLSALASQTITVPSGHAFQGSGLVIGNVTMASGSTLAPGGPGTNDPATLTITNNLVLQAGSTTLMQLSKIGATLVNDQVIATNITYAGTLNVTGVGGGWAAGDTFKLFAAPPGGYSGSFSPIILPVGATWDTSKLSVDGTIKVVTITRPHFGGITRTNANFHLAFSGPGGNSYRLWASTNVAATPVTNTWSLLITNGVFDNVTGAAAFDDLTATNYSRRFYDITVP